MQTHHQKVAQSQTPKHQLWRRNAFNFTGVVLAIGFLSASGFMAYQIKQTASKNL